MSPSLNIGFFLYPGVTQLDATGPAQVLSLLPGACIQMIGRTMDPIPTDAGFSILPTHDFNTCPPLDVLCVPGGWGQGAVMRDGDSLGFLKRQGDTARYVASVCAGSLILGAAGLLNGYRSACHWAFRDMLPAFGAVPVAERIVRDRNRISGGGVTAGIDFGLALAAELAGEDAAREIQLLLENDPSPPFNAGNPASAGPILEARVRARFNAARE